MPIALIAAILLSGSVSYAAEGTAPGDLLYPVKVNVNEKVASAVSVSSEAKAALEARLADRRLQEAAKLASENKLTAKANADLETRFSAHADAVVKNTEKLENEDASAAINIASSFETDLVAHEAVLLEVNAEAKGKSDTNDIRQAIRAKADLIAKIRTRAEEGAKVSASSAVAASVASDPAAMKTATFAASSNTDVKTETTAKSDVRKEVAQKMGVTAKAALKSAQTIFTRISAKLDASVSTRISASISAASKSIRTGDDLYAKSNFSGAFHAYQNAFVSLKRLSVYLNLGDDARLRILPALIQASGKAESDAAASSESQRPAEGTDDSEETRPLQRSIQIEASGSSDSEVKTDEGETRAETSTRTEVRVGL